MIVYKGFNEKLQATHGNGTFQYEPGKTYTEEKSKTRSTGFHAAEYIMDCLNWYTLDGKNRFFRCEAGGSIDEEDGCSMVVSTSLTLEKELNLTEIAFAAMRYIIEHPKRDWRVITRGVCVQEDDAEAIGPDKIAIARGKNPVVAGNRGTVIGLILENADGEIIAASIRKVDDVRTKDFQYYTLTPDRGWVEVHV